MKILFIILFCFGISLCVKSQTIDTLIDVGGYRLHFNIITGKGVPILFESGGGDDGSPHKEGNTYYALPMVGKQLEHYSWS
jgi:hypothetical protein